MSLYFNITDNNIIWTCYTTINTVHGIWCVGRSWNRMESIHEMDHTEFNGSYGIGMNHVELNEWYEIEIRKKNSSMKKTICFLLNKSFCAPVSWLLNQVKVSPQYHIHNILTYFGWTLCYDCAMPQVGGIIGI